MSVGDNFTLVPLSNFFVKKSQAFGPAADPNISSTFPIASGRIETDALNRTGNITGYYTWYRLSHYEGTTGTQGKELREYLLVCRSVSSNAVASFDLPIPEGPFAAEYRSARFLYNTFPTRHPGDNADVPWDISFNTTYSHVHISTDASPTAPVGHSFFFYVMGI
jgi:hypothetical protein